MNFSDMALGEEAQTPEMCIVSCKEKKAYCHVEAQRSTEERDMLFMENFAKANPHLVEAELRSFAEKDKANRKEQEEEMYRKISSDVDEMFDGLKKEGYYKPEEEEDVKPPTGKGRTLDGPPGMINLDDEEGDKEVIEFCRRHVFS